MSHMRKVMLTESEWITSMLPVKKKKQKAKGNKNSLLFVDFRMLRIKFNFVVPKPLDTLEEVEQLYTTVQNSHYFIPFSQQIKFKKQQARLLTYLEAIIKKSREFRIENLKYDLLMCNAQMITLKANKNSTIYLIGLLRRISFGSFSTQLNSDLQNKRKQLVDIEVNISILTTKIKEIETLLKQYETKQKIGPIPGEKVSVAVSDEKMLAHAPGEKVAQAPFSFFSTFFDIPPVKTDSHPKRTESVAPSSTSSQSFEVDSARDTSYRFSKDRLESKKVMKF